MSSTLGLLHGLPRLFPFLRYLLSKGANHVVRMCRLCSSGRAVSHTRRPLTIQAGPCPNLSPALKAARSGCCWGLATGKIPQVKETQNVSICFASHLLHGIANPKDLLKNPDMQMAVERWEHQAADLMSGKCLQAREMLHCLLLLPIVAADNGKQ